MIHSDGASDSITRREAFVADVVYSDVTHGLCRGLSLDVRV